MKKHLLSKFIQKWKQSARFRRNAIIFGIISTVIISTVFILSGWLAYTAIRTAINFGTDPAVQTQIVSTAESISNKSIEVTDQLTAELNKNSKLQVLAQNLTSVACWNKATSLLNPMYILGQPLGQHFDAVKSNCFGIVK
jgi:hypothetical protein